MKDEEVAGNCRESHADPRYRSSSTLATLNTEKPKHCNHQGAHHGTNVSTPTAPGPLAAATARNHRRTVGQLRRSAPTPSSTTTALRWARLGGDSRRRRTAGLAFANETAIGRDPRPVPRPGREQRVRHQRPRKPHQLHRRQRPQLPRSSARPQRRCRRDLLAETQAVLDDFVRENQLAQAAAGDRPPQGPRRRVLPAAVRRPPTARTRVRFVEPGQVATPPQAVGDPAASFGIHTDPADVETVPRLLHRRPAGRRPTKSSIARRTSTPT